MAFKKAGGNMQAAIKMGTYGPPGSGKTFSTLLFAEGIAKRIGKRIAFVDTELGTSFYSMAVPEREIHPQPFDFDAIYTRSITDIIKECQALKFAEHGIIIIDSVTHLWEAAIASYTGPKTKQGSIPMHAWGKIKAPYKTLMHLLINSPFHVFILGRQGNEFTEDPETGEIKAAGVKMKAEGETPYEPHICARMESVKQLKKNSNNKLAAMDAIPTMFIEKDRSGLLQGQVIEMPTFDSVIAPVLKLLGTTQAEVPSTDDAAAHDAEANQKAEADRVKASRELREQFESRFTFALSRVDCDAVVRDITSDVKKRMMPNDVQALRSIYATTVSALEKASEHKPASAPSTNGNGRPHDAPATEPETKADDPNLPEGKGEAWEPPEPTADELIPEQLTQDTRDRIVGALASLSRQWNAKTKTWAEKIIGRPIASAEQLEAMREREGKKVLTELLKLVMKSATAAA